jgi:hypothetical protein
MDWPGSNPSLRCERPATNCLSHDTADSASYCQLSVNILNICVISRYQIWQRANRIAAL